MTTTPVPVAVDPPTMAPDERRLQYVLDLVSARALGHATNAQVEAAVAALVTTATTMTTTTTSSTASTTGSTNSTHRTSTPVSRTRTSRESAARTDTTVTPARTSSPSPTSSSLLSTPRTQVIVPDTENYDDDDDDDHDSHEKSPVVVPSASNHATPKRPYVPSPPAVPSPAVVPPAKRPRGRPRKATLPATSTVASTLDRAVYDDATPLGGLAAEMLVVFGDGPQPLPDTVAAALRGGRAALHVAVRDARALARQQHAALRHHRQALLPYHVSTPASTTTTTTTTGTTKAPTTHPPSSATMLTGDVASQYRVGPQNKHFRDELLHLPECGFTLEQLAQLYPETMQAYQRWMLWHQQAETAAEVATNAKATAAAAVDGDDDPESIEEDGEEETTIGNLKSSSPHATDDDPETNSDDLMLAPPYAGGHLQVRAAQFDTRTDQMECDWYTGRFAKLRQGSFLPSQFGKGRARSGAEQQWELARVQRRATVNNNGCGGGGVGRAFRAAGGWLHMGHAHVRFLHWVGFDPASALPPPDEETTEALAFLAYDFLGRIVETALHQRYIQRQLASIEGRDSVVEDDDPELDQVVVLELPPGEQLTPDDIEQAMQNPEIRPASLFEGKKSDPKNSSHQPMSLTELGAQLYFGPGFETRLEMEVDELAAAVVRKPDMAIPSGVTNEDDEVPYDEDEQFRRQEDEIFASIAAPPTVDGITELALAPNEEETKVARNPTPR